MDGSRSQKEPSENNQPDRKGVAQIRLRNMLKKFEDFVIEHPGPGEIRRFAERLGMSANYLTQIKAGTKVIGDRTARKIEQALHLQPGWLDIDHEWMPRDKYEQEAFALFHKLLRDLPRDKRKQFVDNVRDLYKNIQKQNGEKKNKP